MSEDAAGRATPDLLVVGQITKAHGTRGEVFVALLTDHADAVFAPGQQLLLGDEEGAADEEARVVVVESVRAFKRGVLLKLETVDDRDTADAFARRYLLLPLAALPPLEPDEVFYHELLDMRVDTIDGQHVGRVQEVFETEPHHLLEVVADDGRSRLIPFAERIIREIDREQRRLVIDPPAGLLEL
jgi:16S rRNA processing protein RimM